MSKVIMKGTDAYDRLRERQTVAKFMIVMCVHDGNVCSVGAIVCVCGCVCMCVQMHALCSFMCVCMGDILIIILSVGAHVCVCVCVWVCWRVCARVCVCVCVCVCISPAQGKNSAGGHHSAPADGRE